MAEKVEFNMFKMDFLHLLTLVFIAAKLFDKIDWSWWLVLLPTIVSFGIGVTIIFAVIVIAALAARG